MEKNFKRLCAALLTASILLTLASCGDDKTSENNTNTKENTTIVTTKTPEKTTGDSTTTTHSTTEIEETDTTEATTKTDKTETSQEKPAQVKPTEPKNKPTQVKPTESNTKPTQAKPTEAKPQKATPKFVFPQSFPVKVTAFSAQYEVISAYTSDGYWYNEDTYLFDINITVKRCDDGINEEKASAVQMKIKDSNGNVIRNTSTSAGMLSIGEQGKGCMAWSVDAPGTYTIEFSSI